MRVPMCLWWLAKSESSHVIVVCDKSGADCSSGNETIAGWRCMYFKSVQPVSPAKTRHG